VTAMEVVPSEARTFLEALFAGKPDESHLLLWTLPEKRSHWFQSVDGAIQLAESMRGHDLYIGVGLSGQEYGPARRCQSNDVVGIVGFWADFDIQSVAHAKVALPPTVEDALKILPVQFPPTFIIRTGNGAHAWWLFREPLIFESDEERGDAASLSSRWQTLLRLKAASHGWAFDRLSDLARVLRVPGTRNCKDPANPRPVEIHSQTDRRYDPSDFVEFLDDQKTPDAEEQERAKQTWTEKFADKPLTIDPSASVPEDLLERYMAASPRFRNTWRRCRDDLKDQSQSGYDLALANYGFEAGLSEQQIVDLMIHHRRIHSQRPRTSLDYFQRTIAKAFKRAEEAGLGKRHEMPVQNQLGSLGAVDADGAQRDPSTARALLCEQISAAIGVRVLRIVKVAGQEPTYRMDLETTKIGFANVDQLIVYQKFRMKIASAADHMVPKIKAWDQVAQMMLNALTVEDGGDEADLVGSARIYVEGYLSETPFIDAEEELSYQTKFKPTVYEGQIAVCSIDLQQHINKARGENRAIKEVTAMLSALGASSVRPKRTRLRDQSRWLLPASTFPPESRPETSEESDDVKPS
jgi:hypothetical protein